eukprot:scaffold6802_cov109-Isochrysis_galbana.AAC.4
MAECPLSLRQWAASCSCSGCRTPTDGNGTQHRGPAAQSLCPYALHRSLRRPCSPTRQHRPVDLIITPELPRNHRPRLRTESNSLGRHVRRGRCAVAMREDSPVCAGVTTIVKQAKQARQILCRTLQHCDDPVPIGEQARVTNILLLPRAEEIVGHHRVAGGDAGADGGAGGWWEAGRGGDIGGGGTARRVG